MVKKKTKKTKTLNIKTLPNLAQLTNSLFIGMSALKYHSYT